MAAQRRHLPERVTGQNLVAVERRIARTFGLLHETVPRGTPRELLAKARSIARLRAAQVRRPLRASQS